MTYESRHAVIGAEADAALVSAADRLQLEQEAHADTRAELSAEQTAHEATRQEYDDHMATHSTVPPIVPPAGPTKAQQSTGIQCFADRGAYLDLTGSKNMLKYLGVKKVRSGFGLNTPQGHIDFYNALYDELGITTFITVGKPRVPYTAGNWDNIATTLGKVRGIEVLAGWNEPNAQRNPEDPPLTGWQGLTIKHQHELNRRFAGDYRIGSAQLWSGTITKHNADLDSLAAATVTINSAPVKYKDCFDTTVWHLYQPGKTNMDNYQKKYTGLFGTKPIICSETGMSTAPNQEQGALSMTPAEQAVYLKDHIGMYHAAGHEVYWFELRDDPDPAGTDREKNLGVFYSDKTPKPAAGVLKNLLAT